MEIKRYKFGLLILLLFLFLIFLGYIGCYIKIKNLAITKAVCFEIEKGSNNNDIVNKLCNKVGLNVLYCKILKYKVGNKKLKRGKYCFRSGLVIGEIIAQLEKGPLVKYIKFTIYPGYTKYDIVSELSGESLKKKFLDLVVNKDFIDNLKERFTFLKQFGDINSLEGFLYPDTYYFRPEDLKSILFPKLLIKTVVENFGQKRKNIWANCKKDFRCNPYNLTPYEVLILASIVVKEESKLEYKPLVADILIRRYKNGWFIGADWTLCYGLKVLSKDCYKNINYSTLNDKSNVYNTRVNKGLPPTPIGNPTIEDIKAVLYSKRNDYRYYLHDKKGNIHYGKNLNEHSINRHKYLGY